MIRELPHAAWQAVDGVLLPLSVEKGGLPGGGLALGAWSQAFQGAIMSYRCLRCMTSRCRHAPWRRLSQQPLPRLQAGFNTPDWA